MTSVRRNEATRSVSEGHTSSCRPSLTRRVTFIFFAFALLAPFSAIAESPTDFETLWSDVDPRRDPLETKVVREWEKDGVTFRYVTFTIGTFKKTKARMAAFFGFKKSEGKLPGLLHLHGGGQRAFQHEVEYYAKRGYACLSINWGGREMEDTQAGDANTDWGAVDPTQKNVPGYFNLLPGEKFLDGEESPRNNNWYLLTLGSRRGLTFLEQQPEVDPERLGVYGHSMGGNLTVYVAGTDSRVKVAAPSVGGSGFRTIPWSLLPEQQKRVPRGDMDLFRKTIAFQAYAPHIKCPLLWLSATNDFHGIMDDTYRTGDLIPHPNVRYAMAPHLNHRFTPPFAMSRPLWLDQYLKGTIKFPKTPLSEMRTDDRVPSLVVVAHDSMPIDSVRIYYSIDPDPQARFWRSTETEFDGKKWTAKLPILSVDQPLFAFASVHYVLANPETPPFVAPTKTFAISGKLHTSTPADLKRMEVVATDQPSKVLEDFQHKWRDWYQLNTNNPHHWQFWTRKINDPKWRGKDEERLSFTLTSDDANSKVIALKENFFRSYRGRMREFHAVVDLKAGEQTFELSASDFQTADGTKLTTWKQIDELGLVPYFRLGREPGAKVVGTQKWQGSIPAFQKIRWVDARE